MPSSPAWRRRAAATSGGGTTWPVPTARTSSTSTRSRRSNVSQLEVAWFYPYAHSGLQPDRRRRRDVRAGARELAHRARRHDRQGTLDSRRTGRHHEPRHQLLAERGRQGQAAAVLDQQLPAGDRREDRQVDPDVRRERHRRSARWSRARRRYGRTDSVEQPRQDLEEPHHPGIGARRSVRQSARRHPRLRRRHRARRCGSSTRFRCPASSATTPGRRRPTSTSAASTTGARCRSTTSAASSTSRSGSANYDFYGADRVGQDLFANCLLALDAKTGKRLWHFQTVHHDLWDLDNVSAPQLVTVRHNGKKVDAVAHAGKTGFLYVFDRVTGKPLWPIEERPVPKSEMPGEQAWPTQPFPTKPRAVRAADVHRGRRESVAGDAGAVRGDEGARGEGAQRRDVHAAGVDGHDLDARQPGRIELGHDGGRSRRRAWCSSSASIRSRSSSWRTSRSAPLERPRWRWRRQRRAAAGRLPRLSAVLHRRATARTCEGALPGVTDPRRRHRSHG